MLEIESNGQANEAGCSIGQLDVRRREHAIPCRIRRANNLIRAGTSKRRRWLVLANEAVAWIGSKRRGNVCGDEDEKQYADDRTLEHHPLLL
jgi:hypothetical protein